jgi:type IV pilus assembly protein PilW
MTTQIKAARRQKFGPARRQAGFSLVELMVALTLGLIIVGGVISIFVSNQQAFRSTEALGRLQENARLSFELMAREVRQAGGNPCGTPLVGNVLKSTSWSNDWLAGPIIGYTGATNIPAIQAFGTASADRVAGTDAVKVLGSAVGFAAGIESHDTATARIKLTTLAASLATPTIVLACDGTSGVIAQVSNLVGTDTIEFDTLGTIPGNCSTGFAYTSNCVTPVNRTLAPGGFVAPLSAGFWYVGYNSRGGKSLYRKNLNAAEEIAENVVGMQIRYLLRSEATGALDPDWVEADTVTNWTSTAAKKLVALRFTLELETLSKVGTSQNVITRELIHVVNLRNRPD